MSLSYRLKVTDALMSKDNPRVMFLTRNGAGVHYFSGDETPHALSNLVGADAAELRFALEDCKAGSDAAIAVRSLLMKQRARRPDAKDTFKVEVLS